MSSALINDYVTGLHQWLPAGAADEAADGLIETYAHHLATGSGDQAAAHAAVAEFGDLALEIGEFTRQGACWAAALILSHAWTWPVPGAARLSFGAVLLLAIMTLAVAATSRRSYRRTRFTAAASPVIILLDATAVTAVKLAAPALTWVLGIAMTITIVATIIAYFVS